MIYIPNISNYLPFYIQTPFDDKAVDILASFGFLTKINHFKGLPIPKKPYTVNFKDEDGEEEYTQEMSYQAFELSLTCYCKCYADGTQSAAEVLNKQLLSFFKKVKQNEFMVFNSYTGEGWAKVRYANYSTEEFKARGNWARLIFTITFKVNSPNDRVKLENGRLVKWR